MVNYEQILSSKDNIKKYRIFFKMSRFLKTRSAKDCSNYHNLLVKKYKNIENTINQFKKNLSFKLE